jgi:hypothetical protein
MLEHIKDLLRFMELALSFHAELSFALVLVPSVDWIRVMLSENFL